METPTRSKAADPAGPAAAPPNGSAVQDGHVGAGFPGADPEPEPRRAAPKVRGGFGVMDVVWFLPRLVLRLFFPKLLDRYVMGELLVPLAFGWTLFIVLFVFTVNLFKLAQMAARGARLDTVAQMLGLRIVLDSVYCLPMAMLLAGLLALG